MKIYLVMVLSFGLISCSGQEELSQRETAPVSTDNQSSTDVALDQQSEEFELAGGFGKALNRCSGIIKVMDRNSRNFKRIKCGYPDGVSPGPLSKAPKSTTAKKCSQMEAFQLRKAASYLDVVKIDSVYDANCPALKVFEVLGPKLIRVSKGNDRKFDKLANKDFLLYLSY